MIGYSLTVRAVLTVILLSADADPDEQPDGDWWGSNAWVSNPQDQGLYSEEKQE